jgi:hypothetical protein
MAAAPQDFRNAARKALRNLPAGAFSPRAISSRRTDLANFYQIFHSRDRTVGASIASLPG